jgi:two-component system sensor histidine kinase KdpD
LADDTPQSRFAPPPLSAPGSDAATTTAGDFLALVQQRPRGRLKVYIGSAAGVGKSYRMLQEAHDLRRRGVDVVIGFVETHGRSATAELIRDLEVVARRRFEYRGVSLEDMDIDAIVTRRPNVAIVDELAHTNVPGSRNDKRWKDVTLLLDEGINVISAMNVQHLESLNDVLASALGITVRETVPDWLLASADQVVNIDVSAEDLRERLREGKIYAPEKVQDALRNFFTPENLTTLRELALREVASSVDRSREEIVRRESGAPLQAHGTVERVAVALSKRTAHSSTLLRKASRIAGRLNSDWFCVWVQTPDQRADAIDAATQRAIVQSLQLAESLGAEVVKVEADDVVHGLLNFARSHDVTLLIVGQPQRHSVLPWRRSVADLLVHNDAGVDVLVVPAEERNT